MNVLVTGATGFIGSRLCRALLKRGHCVLALSHSGRTHNVEDLLRHPHFHLGIGDIRHVDWVRGIVKDNCIESVFHLAALLPNGNNHSEPFLYFDINANGTLNVLNAAHVNGVEKFVYASTMSVYAAPPSYLPVDENHPVQPSSIYGATKLSGELLCNTYSKEMKLTVLRYAGVYGYGERQSHVVPTFINQALNNRPLTVHGNGTQTSGFVYVEDVVQGMLLAWENGQPGVYNLGSGQETSMMELAQKIIAVTGSKSEAVLIDKNPERPFRFFLDITKIQKTLGYLPHSLDEGLRLYLKEWPISLAEIKSERG